ncbi:MAG: type II toxin-antitoxin system RelB/DinJ family antitoxin [Candidatus Pacebacteria bacterium]|nr:type II toxin-antitoxin system RelB/DinJ family antitoxin [Candidatus Paceibacterota bacterium]
MTTINHTKTLISIKMDKSLKLDAKKTADEMGISLSTVINAFLRQFVRSKEVTFSIAPRPTASLIRSITRSEKEYKKGHFYKAKNIDELARQLMS